MQNKTVAACLLSLLFPLAASAGGISIECGEMSKAMPLKIGDLPLASKDCAVIPADAAANMHTYPRRWIRAVYGVEGKRFIEVKLDDERQDPMHGMAGNPEIIASNKDAEKTLAEAAAKGIPDFVKGYQDLRMHVRVVPLSQPDEAALTWHDNPETSTTDVQGAVYGTVQVTIIMTAPDIDAALKMLNQANSVINYSVMR